MLIETEKPFWGEKQSIGFGGENEVDRFNLHSTAHEGATGKHLKANDLIAAAQPPPLTRCIKAIC